MSLREKISGFADSIKESFTGGINGLFARLFPWRERRRTRRDQRRKIKGIEGWLSILEMRGRRPRQEQVSFDWYTLKSSQPCWISVRLFTPYRMGELITINKLWSRRVRQNRMRR